MVYKNQSGWKLAYCNRRAEKEVLGLPQDLQADLAHIVGLIETYGLAGMHEPHIKHLSGKLWELRLKARSGIARSIYITAHERRLVILHTFIKKTQQTPHEAMTLALRRAKEEGYL